MSQIKTLNGVQYTLPQFNDTGWGANTGNVLTQYMAAIADVTLQLSGGAFTLTAETDFGANFGLKALYIKSETTNPASAGVLRLAKTDSIKWRNNANGADIALAIDGSDNLQYAATKVLLSGAVVNADINASAAIAYSKLALTGHIVDGDMTAGTLTNTSINASAGIALTKLAAATPSTAAVFAGSGFLASSVVTSTELSYVSGVTSAIQTQLNGKQASGTYIANPLTGDLAAGSHKITGLANGTASGDAAAFGQIGVLQTITGTYATQASSTSSTMADTGISVAITTKVSTSRVLIKASVPMKGVSSTSAVIGVDLAITDSSNNVIQTFLGVFGDNAIASGSTRQTTVTIMATDTPGTAALRTYKIRFARNTNQTDGSVATCPSAFGQSTAYIEAQEVQ